MKHYKVKENGDHFEVHDGRDGRTFKVAKKGLGALEGKVRKMAEGGMIEEEDKIEIPATPTNVAELFSAPAAPVVPAAPIAPSQSANFASPGELDVLANNLKSQQAAQVNPNTVQPKAPEQPTQGGMQQTAFSMPAAAADTGMTDAIKGIQQGAAQQQAAANEQVKLAQNYAAQVNQFQDQAKQKYAALNAENQALQDDIAATKIDPHRLWNSQSTGNKILAGIGVLLSGIGAGATGQENMAMKVINRAIDADIEAQKADLGKKQNLLTMNYRKYGDLQAAESATAAQLNSVVQAQIAAQAARSGSANAGLNSKIAIAQLQQQQQAKQQQTAIAQAQREIFNQGGGENLSPAVAEAVAPGQWVQTPAGIKFAKTKDGAQKVTEAQTKAAAFLGSLEDMAMFNKEVGTTVPGSANSTRAEAKRQQMLLQIKELEGAGALDKGAIAVIEPMLPALGSVRTERTDKQLADLRKYMDNKLNAFYQSQLVNPQGLGAPPTAPQDQGTGMTLSNWKK